MKKILVMVAAAMMAVMNVNAQEGYDNTKHEVAVGLGLWSNSEILTFFEKTTDAIFGASVKDERYFGPVSVEYLYRLKNWIGVGAICTYGQNKEDVYRSNKKDGVYKNTYLTFMPAVKFDWLRKDHFGLYSKVAVGYTLRKEKFDSSDPAGKDVNENYSHGNWQFSLIGVEAGGSTLRGFCVFGMGEQGVAHFGMRYKF